MRFLHSCAVALALLVAWPAQALTADEARAMASGETDDRVAAINKAVPTADARTAEFFQAMADDAVKTTPGRVFVMKDDKGFDPVSGAEARVPEDAEDIVNNNLLRSTLESAMAALRLTSTDEKVRGDAVQTLLNEPDESRLPLIERALAAERVPAIKARLERVRAASMLDSADRARRIEAAGTLAGSGSPEVKLLLNERLAKEDDVEVKAALVAAVRRIDDRLVWGDRINAVFSGISLGSVLLLAALGLAITYGLMGVINMAHGELMMIGAYATYLMQGVFQRYLPEAWFGGYLIAA
ncbi:MAG: urea ABC transporter permease subunit UrtB, partial [Variovorax sp.]